MLKAIVSEYEAENTNNLMRYFSISAQGNLLRFLDSLEVQL